MTYEQLTGKLLDSSDAVIAIGYSGSPEGKNQPSMEGVENVGPIPCGWYTIEGPPVDSPTHGPFVLHLTPDQDTRRFIASLGRNPSSFLMHGDSVQHPGSASQGCIIMPRSIREQVWAVNAVDRNLHVVSGLENE